MSFLGSVPAPMRKLLSGYLATEKQPALVIGSGNFTLPLLLRASGFSGEITCCDVSLYSCALGAFLGGLELEITQKTTCPANLQGLLKTETPILRAASVAMLLDLRETWQAKNAYQQRLLEISIKNWESSLEKAQERLIKLQKSLNQGVFVFKPQCGLSLLKTANRSSVVLAYPPTYKEGYAKMEKILSAVCEWAQPEYTVLMDSDPVFFEAVKQYQNFYVVLEHAHDQDFALGSPKAVVSTGRAKKIYLYTKDEKTKVSKNPAKSVCIAGLLDSEKIITGKETLSLCLLRSQQVTRLKELFLSKRVDYAASAGLVNLGFLLDGSLFGMGSCDLATLSWKFPEDLPFVYLRTDLALPSTNPRLSKLVLMALLSNEVKEILDTKRLENHGYVATTAFSASPISMKYRGVFNLHSRKEKNGGFLLNYFARFSGDTLQQTFESWWKKYNKPLI